MTRVIHTLKKPSLVMIPHPKYASTLYRNFIVKARRTNANTTFTTFNHPPDFGSFFIIPGKNEKITKGRENAIPNTAIPNIGLRATPPITDAARIEPTNGPVHENDTITIAKATKNAAI